MIMRLPVAATLGLPAVTGTGSGDDVIPTSTSSDSMYRQYRVTITPHAKKGDPEKTFDVKVKVKNFHDNGATVRNTIQYRLGLVSRRTCRMVGRS